MLAGECVDVFSGTEILHCARYFDDVVAIEDGVLD